MKKNLFLLTLSALTLLTGCNGGNSGNSSVVPASSTTSADTSSVATSSVEQETCSGDFATYTLKFESSIGVAFKQKKVTLTCAEHDVSETATTNKSGIASFKNIFAHNYTVTIEDVDEYEFPEMKVTGNVKKMKAGSDGNYSFSQTFTADPVIIDTKLAAGTTYSVGDVIHDFTYTDVKGNSYKVSDLLKTYSCIFLDLFYINCTYCLKEYDALVDLHEEYCEDVFFMGVSGFAPDYDETYYSKQETAIRAAYEADEDYYSQYFNGADDMVNYYIDTDENMLQAISDYKLNYSIGKDPVVTEVNPSTGYGECLTTALGISGYPTAVIIDRYGYITYMHSGWIYTQSGNTYVTDKAAFRKLFDTYIGEDYEPTLY